MSVPFVSVQVEEHEELPEGCSLRFKAQGEGRVVREVSWESDDGVAGMWTVVSMDSDGTRGDALAFAVDDSSAGTSILVIGGAHGLRLTSEQARETVAVPYLLLGPRQIRFA